MLYTYVVGLGQIGRDDGVDGDGLAVPMHRGQGAAPALRHGHGDGTEEKRSLTWLSYCCDPPMRPKNLLLHLRVRALGQTIRTVLEQSQCAQ